MGMFIGERETDENLEFAEKYFSEKEFKKMKTSNREDGLQIQEHRQEWNRYPNQELFTFEIPYNKEELVKNLKEEFEINEEAGDYIIYTPAKIRICKKS